MQLLVIFTLTKGAKSIQQRGMKNVEFAMEMSMSILKIVSKVGVDKLLKRNHTL